MAKARLSNKQLQNIKKHRLKPAPGQSQTAKPLQLGLVLGHYGKRVDIEAENGKKYPCQFRRHLKKAVAGDHVLWQKDKQTGEGIIAQILTRKNALQRPNKYSKQTKTIAANIDQLIMMIAIEPAPIEHYIDRYLVIADSMKIPAMIVVNKIDLLEKSPHQGQIRAIQTLYRKLGVPILMFSARKQVHLAKLRHVLAGKTSVLIGQSGVGKSATLNALFGKMITTTGAISTRNKRGKHTTTTATLHHLDRQTQLIDSPGIREFGIWHLSEGEIFAGFHEFTALEKHCRFRNCRHLEDTPGCAIDEAVKNAKISYQRFLNYHRLIREMETCTFNPHL